ncbi:MAG: molybdate ABC transporter substrate-binding protein, partial [Actinomycetota bacterium]|nr:molybdate ABC transporter substrate-binding protein [Actinomycetota bacterium]
MVALAGCGDGQQSAAASGSTTDGASGVGGQITVFAAASLTEVFTEIAVNFEQANPDADVQFNFAGSSTLAQQIRQGAPADVFAAASPRQMQDVVDTGAAKDARVFVANVLQIVV